MKSSPVRLMKKFSVVAVALWMFVAVPSTWAIPQSEQESLADVAARVESAREVGVDDGVKGTFDGVFDKLFGWIGDAF